MKSIGLTLFVSVLFFAPLAQTKNLKDIDPGVDFLSKEEIRFLLGDYPTPGSPAGIKDLGTLMWHQYYRTKEECSYASSQDSISLESLFVQNNGPLSQEEADKLKLELGFLYLEAGYNILRAKNIYQRARPYVRHSQVRPCIPKESSYSYPSGHSTLGRVLARSLSEIFPERAGLFMQRSDEISQNRVIGGVHYPSDVTAGKVLGDEIADLAIRTEAFDQLRQLMTD